MSALPAPLVELDDDHAPVTVWLTPPQAARLEVLLAYHRDADPAVDEDALLDAIFVRGLDAAEAEICR